MKDKIIALSGLKYSGKDTTARCIINQLCQSDINAMRFAFADRLKTEVCAAFGIPLIELEANKAFWRPILQFWGNEFRRVYQKDDEYWVKLLRNDLKIFFNLYNNGIAIITDCRYPNEMRFIRNNFDAKILWIDRSKVNKLDITGNTQHASERSINFKDCDYVVDNNSDLKNLDNSIYAILRASKII